MATQPLNSIVFTGGGSAGHVTPNLPLIRRCLKDQWKVFYIGSMAGIEKTIIQKESIPYFSISSGKLRRYFSWQNFTDPFKILLGIAQAVLILKKTKPKVIFSKGGFVSFPVVMAGKLLGIPVIIHESDLTPGLSNRLCFPFAQKICLTFQETQELIKKYSDKLVTAGAIIREEAHAAQPEEGRRLCELPNDKKIIFVYGGSQGSEIINQTLREALPELLQDFYVIHSCGPNKVDLKAQQPGYVQFDYLHETFYHILACADLVISRSGSNSLSELLLFQKPHLLIPLSQKASRGEQIFNSRYFAKRGTCLVIEEETLNKKTLVEAIHQLMLNQEKLKASMKKHAMIDGTQTIYEMIKAT